jgi:hypothetical protein
MALIEDLVLTFSKSTDGTGAREGELHGGVQAN